MGQTLATAGVRHRAGITCNVPAHPWLAYLPHEHAAPLSLCDPHQGCAPVQEHRGRPLL